VQTPSASRLRLLVAGSLAAWVLSASIDTADAKRKSRKRARKAAPVVVRNLPPPTSVEMLVENIRAIVSGATLKRGTTAVYVVDTDGQMDDPILAIHPDTLLNCASNVKLISTAAVLDIFGADFRFTTHAYGPMPDRNGTVPGSIYVLGQDDPTFGLKDLESLAKGVKKAGVKTIEGDIAADPKAGGLPRVVFRVIVRASRPGKPASVDVSPDFDFVTVRSRARTGKGRKTRLRVDVQPGKDNRLVVSIAGTIARNKSQSFIRSSRDSAYTLRAFKHFLEKEGVHIKGSVVSQTFENYTESETKEGELPVELAAVQSPTIGELVAQVNKRSLNELADSLIRAAGAAYLHGPASMENGVRTMHRWLESAGIAAKDLFVDTGSGLSRRTKISVKQLTRVLLVAAGLMKRAEQGEPYGHAFLRSLSIGGRDGTLRARFRGTNARVFAKTGTLNGVIALSGFVEASQRRYVFSIVSNGIRGWEAVRREHEQIVLQIAKYLENAPPPEKPIDLSASGPLPEAESNSNELPPDSESLEEEEEADTL
jgi:D-alanyl-D-alanine carboxypeptidase/D-alanyl-D-alanine-endopeptidase (penicillin-binding protein 4)